MASFFNAIELPTYSPASEIVPKPGTIVGVTSGGTVIGHGVGPDKTHWNLEYSGLTFAQKEALRIFFLSTIRGAYSTFTFTDKDSATFTVRWWNEWAIKPDATANGTSWSGFIELREE